MAAPILNPASIKVNKQLYKAVDQGKVLDVSKLKVDGTGTVAHPPLAPTYRGSKKQVGSLPVISDNKETYELAMQFLGPEYHAYVAYFPATVPAVQLTSVTPKVTLQLVSQMSNLTVSSAPILQPMLQPVATVVQPEVSQTKDMFDMGARARTFYIPLFNKEEAEAFNELEAAELDNTDDPELGDRFRVQMEMISKAVRTAIPDIKRGDIIDLEQDGYRNSGKLIWNGEAVESLDYDIDDYGAVPPDYQIVDAATGFNNPYYWSDAVDHNYISWPSIPLRQQLLANLSKEPSEIHGEWLFTSFMIVNGLRFEVLIHFEMKVDQKVSELRTIAERMIEDETAHFDRDEDLESVMGKTDGSLLGLFIQHDEEEEKGDDEE